MQSFWNAWKISSVICQHFLWWHVNQAAHFFTGTTFYGYEDLGEGPGEKPAKHVMMMMATALNMSFKVPVGYFLLPDAFSSEKRAELLRNCIFHVNTTGAIVTNLVMDNCPVNYATYRRLYHLYSTLYWLKPITKNSSLPKTFQYYIYLVRQISAIWKYFLYIFFLL